MSWSGFPVTGASDWSHVNGQLQQIIKACNERDRATTVRSTWDENSGFDELEVGDDVQDYQLFRDLQNFIETRAVSSFADKTDPVITDADITPPAGASSTFGSWALSNCFNRLTLSKLRSNAGLNAAGFTRKYYDGGGNLTTGYGLMQAGDIIGAWLFNEMKAALDEMTVVCGSVSAPSLSGFLGPAAWALTMDVPIATPRNYNLWEGDASDGSDYGTAYSTFASEWPESESDQSVVSSLQVIDNWMKESVAVITNSPSYEQFGEMRRGRVWNNELPNWVSRKVDVYAYAWATRQTDGEFATHGETLTENRCVLMDTIASSTDSPVGVATFFPSTSAPAQVPGGSVPDPPAPGPFDQNTFNYGFYAIPVIAIDYGVAGGFVYQ